MNIVLFGVGPHAKIIYLKYIQKVDFIDKVLIVDLKHRRKAIEEVVNKFDFDYELLLLIQLYVMTKCYQMLIGCYYYKKFLIMT